MFRNSEKPINIEVFNVNSANIIKCLSINGFGIGAFTILVMEHGTFLKLC